LTSRSLARPATAVFASLAALMLLASVASAGSGLPLQAVARVPLSGPAVRFDYASIDPSTDRLWVAHMDAGQLLAVDLRTRRIVRTIPAPGVHGVLAVPALGRVYASATDARQVLTIDARSGKILAAAPAGRYPDGLAYDPVERHVFVSDESGGVETVINTAGHRLATIPLGGEAGNVQYDPGSGHVLADVQTRDDIAVIDPRTNRIVRRIPVPGCVSDHGLYIDASRELAFVACDQNATLHTLDLRSMTWTGQDAVGSSPDVLAFDGADRRLYVAAESGVVAVFAETAHGARRLGLAFLAHEAHTVAVDPRTHLVYFPLQSGSSGGPQLLVMRPTGVDAAAIRPSASAGAPAVTTPASPSDPPAGGGGIGGDPRCSAGQIVMNAGPGAGGGDSEDEDDFGGPDDGDGCI
jgi:hypothetical protein